MDDHPTIEVRFARDPHEFLDFIREHPDARAADSVAKRAKGVRVATDEGEVILYLKLADMIDSADNLGEITRTLLVTSTGQLIRDLAEAP